MSNLSTLPRCTKANKVRYETYAQAFTRLNEVQAQDNSGQAKVPGRIYRCDHCEDYHFTSRAAR